MDDDPYTQIYKGLWRVIESRPFLKSLVKVGNRVDYTSDLLDPSKTTEQSGDWPSIRLIPAGGGVVGYTSSGVNLEIRFRIELNSGDARVNKAVFPVKWELVKAIIGPPRNNFDLDFVQTVDLEDVDYSLEEASGTKQWLGVTDVTVRFYASNEQLRA